MKRALAVGALALALLPACQDSRAPYCGENPDACESPEPAVTDDRFYAEFPDSTALDHIVYYPSTGTLEVVFKSQPAEYTYCDVPGDTIRGLVDADSAGSYFHDYIADQYDTAVGGKCR